MDITIAAISLIDSLQKFIFWVELQAGQWFSPLSRLAQNISSDRQARAAPVARLVHFAEKVPPTYPF